MSEKPIIGYCECPECKTRNEMRLNKNGIAYYYCTKCCHHERFSREATNKMIEQNERGSNAELPTNGGGGNDQPGDDKGTKPIPDYANDGFGIFGA